VKPTTERERRPPAKAAPIVPARRALNVLYAVVYVVPAIFGSYFGLPALVQRATVLQTVAHYHAQCPALTLLLDSTTSPARCPAQTAQVVDHYAHGSGRTTSRWIAIQVPTGQRYPLYIGDDDVWNGIAVGQQAVAQVWEGHVTGLVVNDHVVQTNDNPDIVSGGNNAWLLLMGMGVGGSSIFLILPLFLKSASSLSERTTLWLARLGCCGPMRRTVGGRACMRQASGRARQRMTATWGERRASRLLNRRGTSDGSA